MRTRTAATFVAAVVAIVAAALGATTAAPASAAPSPAGQIITCYEDSAALRSDTCQHPQPECRDGSDNDIDGATDYPDDPGCQSILDDSESPDPPQCSDRRDNDADGRIDYPDDRGCESATDDDETGPNRVVDFDGDGITDLAVFRPSAEGATWHVRKAGRPRRHRPLRCARR